MGPDGGDVDKRAERAERVREATRARILEVARSMIRSGTYLDVTVAAIADALGLSRPTVYRYFPAVEDLFKALSDEVFERVFNSFSDASPADPQFLDEMLSSSIKVFLDDPKVNRALVLISATGRGSGTWFQIDPEGIIREAMKQRPPELRPVSEDADLAARMIITYFRGALYGWAAGFLSDTEFEIEARRADEISPTAS
jgi:AcrR family transcriptional regulator